MSLDARDGAERRTGLILAAHGSLEDALANAVVRGQAERVRSLGLFDEVTVAFHRGEPSFKEALDRIQADQVTVVPLMTSSGYYSRVVLPGELRKSARYPIVQPRVTDPVGTHPGMAAIIESRARHLLESLKLDRTQTSLVLVGHGTRRHRESRQATEMLVDLIRGRRWFPETVAVFLDEEPAVERAIDLVKHENVILVPFLIAAGPHAVRDIPTRAGLRVKEGSSPPFAGNVGRRFVACDTAVGGDPGILGIILDLSQNRARRPRHRTGKVSLVGAGPGDPELITVKGLRALQEADVIVHDRLVEPGLLRKAGPEAELLDVGKGPGGAGPSQEEIEAILVDRAKRGQRVVRLKGGDPFVFGRGWEEARACRDADVDCEVVPGVSSAVAVPAAAGIPMTLRGAARSFAVLTARSEDDDATAMAELEHLRGADTLVILMGRANLGRLMARLRAAGRDPDTPVACIERGTTARQRVATGTLSTIAAVADAMDLRAPVTTVVGDVAGLPSLHPSHRRRRPEVASRRPSPP